MSLRFFQTILISGTSWMRLPWTVTVPTWVAPVKTSPLSGRVLSHSGWLNPDWLILGGKETLPTSCAGGFSRHSQPWAKISALGSCYHSEILLSPREPHTSGRGTACFATGPGLLPLGEGSFSGVERSPKPGCRECLGSFFTAAALGWDLPGQFWSTLQGTHEALSRRGFVPALWALCQDSSYKSWVLVTPVLTVSL